MEDEAMEQARSCLQGIFTLSLGQWVASSALHCCMSGAGVTTSDPPRTTAGPVTLASGPLLVGRSGAGREASSAITW